MGHRRRQDRRFGFRGEDDLAARIRAVFILAALLPGCSLFSTGDEEYVDSPWYEGPEEILWDVTLEVISRDFHLGDVNEATGGFESQWKERLSPFKAEGRRWKTEGVVETQGELHRVRLQVVVETNMELDQPLNTVKAKWRKRTLDPMQARVLQRHIHTALLEAGFAVREPIASEEDAE